MHSSILVNYSHGNAYFASLFLALNYLSHAYIASTPGASGYSAELRQQKSLPSTISAAYCWKVKFFCLHYIWSHRAKQCLSPPKQVRLLAGTMLVSVFNALSLHEGICHSSQPPGSQWSDPQEIACLSRPPAGCYTLLAKRRSKKKFAIAVLCDLLLVWSL